MRVEKASNVKPRGRTATRIIKLALPLILGLIVLAVLLAPAFISSEKGRRLILAKINGAITGKADFADLSMGWLKGIKVANLSFNDAAGEISVKVERVSTKPAYRSILTGKLSLGRTVIDKPRVEVNLHDLRERATKKPGDQPPVPGATGTVAWPITRLTSCSTTAA